jgi:eukaryotic-like serine/threonine-protein kinase
MEPHEHATVLSRAPGGTSARLSSGFPTDLLDQSARRLRVLALMYALVFFLAGLFPALLFPEDRARLFSSPLLWAPAVVGIMLGVVVALAVGSARVPLQVTMTFGLVFEVVSSYTIAAAEFADPSQIEMHAGFLGLSWVAVWVVLFTIVVPTTPRRAVMAALASVSAVPVVIGVVLALSPMAGAPNPFQFFFALVFPYLLVVGMAYVGAGVVYQLGSEVKRARELGSYYLEEKLGQGGMGEVWRAKHRLLARPAAVKLIRPGLADGAFGGASQRFEREAQVIAGLRSPHTVTLFDFGMAGDGSFYYAMELLEGLDADRLVQRFGPMTPARVIQVLRQVCHSLSEAQSRGLVHRDIKPANIFLCRYGEEVDFVKVLDFGIVRAVHHLSEANLTQTADLAIQGTPAFMAPEQAMGRDVDSRTDIYATGCLAFWLLTGTTVFHADTPIAMLIQHAQADPFPPSARAKQPIPSELDQLVLACLAKDPAKRPQSARDLERRLTAVRVADTWTSENASAWWSEHLPAPASTQIMQ